MWMLYLEGENKAIKLCEHRLFTAHRAFFLVAFTLI